MTMLPIKAFARQLFLLFSMATRLFTAAGTVCYWQAGNFPAVYFTASIAMIRYLEFVAG
jgi:hypothetical protein